MPNTRSQTRKMQEFYKNRVVEAPPQTESLLSMYLPAEKQEIDLGVPFEYDSDSSHDGPRRGLSPGILTTPPPMTPDNEVADAEYFYYQEDIDEFGLPEFIGSPNVVTVAELEADRREVPLVSDVVSVSNSEDAPFELDDAPIANQEIDDSHMANQEIDMGEVCFNSIVEQELDMFDEIRNYPCDSSAFESLTGSLEIGKAPCFTPMPELEVDIGHVDTFYDNAPESHEQLDADINQFFSFTPTAEQEVDVGHVANVYDNAPESFEQLNFEQLNFDANEFFCFTPAAEQEADIVDVVDLYCDIPDTESDNQGFFNGAEIPNFEPFTQEENPFANLLNEALAQRNGTGGQDPAYNWPSNSDVFAGSEFQIPEMPPMDFVPEPRQPERVVYPQEYANNFVYRAQTMNEAAWQGNQRM